MNAPKILYFVTEDWFVCSHWLPQITAAHANGYDVYVLTRVARHREIIEARGATVIPLNIVRSSRNPLRELQLIREIAAVYSEIRPDLVQHIALKPVIYGTLVAAMTGTRRVINYMAGLGWLFTARNHLANLLRQPMGLVLSRLLKRGHVIVENPSDFRHVTGMGLAPERITLIPGAGVDMNEFAPTPEPEGVPLILMAARMLWSKGVGEFVGAAELLQQRGVSARFVLAGSPDDENPASVPATRLEAWQQDGLVEWWGRCEDMASVFAKTSIVCLPTSYGEGVPKVLIEAAAAGRAIVATGIPGCREIVREGVNGLLIPEHDPVALADALEKLLTDRPLRLQMGERGRQIAEKDFSQEHVVRLTLNLYEKLLDAESINQDPG